MMGFSHFSMGFSSSPRDLAMKTDGKYGTWGFFTDF